MTKEELLRQIEGVKIKKEALEKQEEHTRKRLSEMLDSPFKKDYYSNDKERIVYSWEKIYFELGKLKAALTFYDLEGNVNELECAIADIKADIKNSLNQTND